MKWLDWEKIEGSCRYCKMFFIDEVPKKFEDPKLGLQVLEFPVTCKHCSRTRFYAVRKEISARGTPRPEDHFPYDETKV